MIQTHTTSTNFILLEFPEEKFYPKKFNFLLGNLLYGCKKTSLSNHIDAVGLFLYYLNIYLWRNFSSGFCIFMQWKIPFSTLSLVVTRLVNQHRFILYIIMKKYWNLCLRNLSKWFYLLFKVYLLIRHIWSIYLPINSSEHENIFVTMIISIKTTNNII